MDQPSSILAKALSAILAGVLAFTLTAGSLLLGAALFEGWIILVSFAAVPAAAIAALPFRARLFCFGLGLVAMAGAWLLDATGPDNPLIMLTWIAMCFAGAAVVAEVCVRSVAWWLGRQGCQPGAPRPRRRPSLRSNPASAGSHTSSLRR
ncbi:MAG TPA: hypothetical protein VF548_00610 [Allosphingosinicella sp.]